MDQRSEEWFAARRGKVTASRIADVMSRTRNGWGASRGNYMAELIAERLGGESPPRFVSAAMQWGTDVEPDARDAYEFFADAGVDQVGFIDHPDIPKSGASPDGLVGDDGMLEIKCPVTATHLDTLLGAAIDKRYILQMQWQMACADRRWCDFVSFDPRLPEAMQFHCRRVQRDEKLISEIADGVRGFLSELDQKIARLRDIYKLVEAA